MVTPDCPQPCEHLSQQDAREGKGCAEHPCMCEAEQARYELDTEGGVL